MLDIAERQNILTRTRELFEDNRCFLARSFYEAKSSILGNSESLISILEHFTHENLSIQ